MGDVVTLTVDEYRALSRGAGSATGCTATRS